LSQRCAILSIHHERPECEDQMSSHLGLGLSMLC
jgi:hypothetical protein